LGWEENACVAKITRDRDEGLDRWSVVVGTPHEHVVDGRGGVSEGQVFHARSAVGCGGGRTRDSDGDRSPTVTARDFLRVVRNPIVVGVVLIGFLMQSGQFLVYTYIAPVTRLITGGGNLMVTGALLLFGVAAIAGNALGGVGADRIGSVRMVLASLTVFTAAYLVLGVLGGLAHSPFTFALAAVTTIAWGIASWAFVPPQQAQLVRAAPQQSAVALSLNVFAIYAGIAVGGALGGVILADKHTDALPYAGATLTAVALLVAVGAGRWARRRDGRRPAESGAVPDEVSLP
jgi:predicted MFS family arabinose efflux permease